MYHKKNVESVVVRSASWISFDFIHLSAHVFQAGLGYPSITKEVDSSVWCRNSSTIFPAQTTAGSMRELMWVI